ncbi:Maf family protein [Rhodovulum adriaticum]|uniref:Nucleoside triphosphate pyrophosphatase n=1 Tax=Rhodovulum adriaticum TaxID=35804 RepID=A0A4R2NZ50_RHOAD|nr:Maf family protein [Rhodovulum adriaticum]MBK1634870.1 septum formation protein Maf [Rhodovulum adriaticum]TCP27550.1 septum formation protein [Rhodovulum adriaticum]
MSQRIVLASGSPIRRHLLQQAHLDFDVIPARVDEDAIRNGMQAENATPEEIAEALAAFKAQRVAEKDPQALVIGCDQVLAHRGAILAKPETVEEARAQLRRLRGGKHELLSAVVIYDDLQPLWRHVGRVTLTMRPFSDTFLDHYLERNWDSVRQAVGAYKLEEEGVRLFSAIEGDYFDVLGLPLLPLLTFLTTRGVLEA